MCNKACASIHPVTLNVWLTATLNLLWSAVYQKNCHLVCRNPYIRASPQFIWKIHTKTHQQQRDEEIVKVLQQDCSKLCSSKDFSLYPSISWVCLICLPRLFFRSLRYLSTDQTSSSLPSPQPLLCLGEGHYMASYQLFLFKMYRLTAKSELTINFMERCPIPKLKWILDLNIFGGQATVQNNW